MHPSCSWFPPDVPAVGGRPCVGHLVRGRSVSLQQASCGQQGRPGAHRGNDGCGSGPSTQPGQEGVIVNQGSRPHSTWDQDDVVTGGGIHVLGGHNRRSLTAANRTRFDGAERHLVPVRQPTPQFNRAEDVEEFEAVEKEDTNLSTHAIRISSPQACLR